MNENTNENFLQKAYEFGTYDHAGLGSTFASRELLLREHVLTCLYWFPGKNPMSSHLMGRVDEVLPNAQARTAYLAHYKHWGQQMKQAEAEGMALRRGTSDFMRAGAPIEAPKMHHPQLVLDFITQNYSPGKVLSWQAFPQEAPRDLWPKFCDRLTVRTREAICQLGVFLEYAMEDPKYSDYLRIMERTLFTLMAVNPIVRLGMPPEFSVYMRQSVFSLTLYYYQYESDIRRNFKELPESYYSQLMESLSDMSNLIPANRGYSEPECSE